MPDSIVYCGPREPLLGALKYLVMFRLKVENRDTGMCGASAHESEVRMYVCVVCLGRPLYSVRSRSWQFKKRADGRARRVRVRVYYTASQSEALSPAKLSLKSKLCLMIPEKSWTDFLRAFLRMLVGRTPMMKDPSVVDLLLSAVCCRASYRASYRNEV